MSPRATALAMEYDEGHKREGTDPRLAAPSPAPPPSASAGTDPAILAGQWARVRARLKDELGEAQFRSWLQDLRLQGAFGGELILVAGSKFSCEEIRSRYGERIHALWRRENAAIKTLEFRIDGAPSSADVHAASTDAERTETIANREPAREADVYTVGADGTALPALLAPAEVPGPEPLADLYEEVNGPLDPRLTFEQFIVGKPNELAHAAARRVAECPATPGQPMAFNPLFLYGGVGLGKTHLMHAIAWGIRRRDPNRRVMYLSAEKFMYRFIRALRVRDTMSFKEQFRSVDVLMIDDVQFISGKESTQEEFFHTFNALVDQKKQIVISADKSPSDLEGIEDRMKSRLGWGLVADIHPTTYELRLGILQSKADHMRLVVPPRVLEFIAHKITANVRELEGALTRIAAYVQLVGREITLESTEEVLRDVLRANDRRLTIEDIQKKVAEFYKIRLADMHSSRRTRVIARPRQVAMYLCKQLTPRSLPEIGRKFGGRDHTTVIHAVRTIEALIASDKEMAEDVKLLMSMLGG